MTTPDTEVLSAGITFLGGQWPTALIRDVTHLFPLPPGFDKYETAMNTCMKVLLRYSQTRAGPAGGRIWVVPSEVVEGEEVGKYAEFGKEDVVPERCSRATDHLLSPALHPKIHMSFPEDPPLSRPVSPHS
jgi:hypothetical protein